VPSFHPVSASYDDTNLGISIVSKSMTITPIVEIDRTGGGVVKEIITVLESPKGHIWALLTVTISSTSSGKTDYDFNEIALVTQKGKRLIPLLAKKSHKTSSILSGSYGGSEVPFIWSLEKGDQEYSMFYDVDLTDTPVFIKIGDAEPVNLNMPPEEFKKTPMIIAS